MALAAANKTHHLCFVPAQTTRVPRRCSLQYAVTPSAALIMDSSLLRWWEGGRRKGKQQRLSVSTAWTLREYRPDTGCPLLTG